MLRLQAISLVLFLAVCRFARGGQVHVVEKLDCPRLIHYVRPTYPKDAKRQRIQGTVKLRVLIGVAGELRNIEVLDGNPVLAPAALRAVKKWRYSVCRLNGTPVESVTTIDVPFNLGQ